MQLQEQQQQTLRRRLGLTPGSVLHYSSSQAADRCRPRDRVPYRQILVVHPGGVSSHVPLPQYGAITEHASCRRPLSCLGLARLTMHHRERAVTLTIRGRLVAYACSNMHTWHT